MGLNAPFLTSERLMIDQQLFGEVFPILSESLPPLTAYRLTTNGAESLLALVNGKFVDIRVPYPLGFFTKNVDGRIDDPNAGWKGRGLWTTFGSRTPFHNEGGVQNQPKVYKVQVRPDPLAH